MSEHEMTQEEYEVWYHSLSNEEWIREIAIGKRWCDLCETLNYISDIYCKYCGEFIIGNEEDREYFKHKETQLRKIYKLEEF